MACQAVRTAIATLAIATTMVAVRMEIQGFVRGPDASAWGDVSFTFFDFFLTFFDTINSKLVF